ncbi:MAG: hypothetical protein ABH879_00075 [archaeon]
MDKRRRRLIRGIGGALGLAGLGGIALLSPEEEPGIQKRSIADYAYIAYDHNPDAEKKLFVIADRHPRKIATKRGRPVTVIDDLTTRIQVEEYRAIQYLQAKGEYVHSREASIMGYVPDQKGARELRTELEQKLGHVFPPNPSDQLLEQVFSTRYRTDYFTAIDLMLMQEPESFRGIEDRSLLEIHQGCLQTELDNPSIRENDAFLMLKDYILHARSIAMLQNAIGPGRILDTTGTNCILPVGLSHAATMVLWMTNGSIHLDGIPPANLPEVNLHFPKTRYGIGVYFPKSIPEADINAVGLEFRH